MTFTAFDYENDLTIGSTSPPVGTAKDNATYLVTDTGDASGAVLEIWKYDRQSSTWLLAGGAALAVPLLPAPKVQMYNPAVRPDVFVSDGFPSGGATLRVGPTRYVKVTVPGLPQAILDDLAGYAPQVELMRYTRLRTRENAAGGNGDKSSGFVHPSHGIAASGNGSFTHGGIHGGVGAGVQAIRPTEWPILAGNDAIDVTQGILGFMCLVGVQYRESTGGYTSVDALVPSHALSRGGGGAYSRFPYQKRLSGAYYSFRLSIKDPSDLRGKRIHGPLSEIIYCGNTRFPFAPDGLEPGGRAAAKVADGFDPRPVNFWFSDRKPG